VDAQLEKVAPIFEGELPNLIQEIEQRSIPIDN